MKRFSIADFFSGLFGGGAKKPVPKKGAGVHKPPGVGLRQMALFTPAKNLGFFSDAEFPRVFGVLMDWDIGGSVATVVSMRGGMASLYTTTTFGIIGGEGHVKVRQAAVEYVKLAGQYFDSGKFVTEFPYPKPGQVFYYLLTYDGVRMCVGDEEAIKREADSTKPLFDAAQGVLSELRMTLDLGRGR